MLVIYTLIHVVISLIGIGSGLVVLYGLLFSKRLDGWTMVFLSTTMATNITGFFFPFHGLKPSYIVGAISTVILILAYLARYRHNLAGAWRATYVVTAVIGLYLNVFVLIVQAFLKVPALHALAPTQTEPPFKMAQLAMFVLFIVMGAVSVKKFHVPEIPA